MGRSNQLGFVELASAKAGSGAFRVPTAIEAPQSVAVFRNPRREIEQLLLIRLEFRVWIPNSEVWRELMRRPHPVKPAVYVIQAISFVSI
jgi:hypothetical protein